MVVWLISLSASKWSQRSCLLHLTKAPSLELTLLPYSSLVCGCGGLLFLLKVTLRSTEVEKSMNYGQGGPGPGKLGFPNSGAAFGFVYYHMHVWILLSFTWKRELGNSREFWSRAVRSVRSSKQCPRHIASCLYFIKMLGTRLLWSPDFFNICAYIMCLK